MRREPAQGMATESLPVVLAVVGEREQLWLRPARVNFLTTCGCQKFWFRVEGIEMGHCMEEVGELGGRTGGMRRREIDNDFVACGGTFIKAMKNNPTFYAA